MSEDNTTQDEKTARLKAFIEDYGKLVAKHKIDFTSYPVFAPNGNGTFTITVQTSPIEIPDKPVLEKA